MNTPVKTLITEAVLVDRNLQLLTDRLQGLKRQIINAAAASRETHQPTNGGGSAAACCRYRTRLDFQVARSCPQPGWRSIRQTRLNAKR